MLFLLSVNIFSPSLFQRNDILLLLFSLWNILFFCIIQNWHSSILNITEQYSHKGRSKMTPASDIRSPSPPSPLADVIFGWPLTILLIKTGVTWSDRLFHQGHGKMVFKNVKQLFQYFLQYFKLFPKITLSCGLTRRQIVHSETSPDCLMTRVIRRGKLPHPNINRSKSRIKNFLSFFCTMETDDVLDLYAAKVLDEEEVSICSFHVRDTFFHCSRLELGKSYIRTFFMHRHPELEVHISVVEQNRPGAVEKRVLWWLSWFCDPPWSGPSKCFAWIERDPNESYPTISKTPLHPLD